LVARNDINAALKTVNPPGEFSPWGVTAFKRAGSSMN